MKFILAAIAKLPFSGLHVISDGMFYLLYYGIGYRKKVVRGNLLRSFPEKTLSEIKDIEKKFYRNFCDLFVETIKIPAMSQAEHLKRVHYTNPEVTDALFAEGKNLSGFSSHLANWEFLALGLALGCKHLCYCIYKPLSNQKINDFILSSRERFGVVLVSIKNLRSVFSIVHDRPYMLGLLSDQSPHDFNRAFEVQFLNQKTYIAAGAAVLSVERGLTPVWGWMRRTGRSRFEWGIDLIEVDESFNAWTDSEKEQIKRIASVHSLTEAQSAKALLIVQEYSRRLEARIKMAPQDWLWSHRRWKNR